MNLTRRGYLRVGVVSKLNLLVISLDRKALISCASSPLIPKSWPKPHQAVQPLAWLNGDNCTLSLNSVTLHRSLQLRDRHWPTIPARSRGRLSTKKKPPQRGNRLHHSMSTP